MSANFNIVTFMPDPPPAQDGGGGDAPQPRIALLLEEPWKMTAGVEPNLNKATCSYLEFAKFNGNPAVQGTVEFWFSSAPPSPRDDDGSASADVTINDVSIIDADMAEVGIVSGGTATQITMYRLFLADFRQRFIAPRGGRLEVGLINPALVQSAAGIDDQSANDDEDTDEGTDPSPEAPAPDQTTTDRPNSDLIGLCLAAMGLGSTVVPGTVDTIDPPRGLQWFGNHAPTELNKLLLHCGHCFCPNLDGTAAIFQLGSGSAPTIPANRLIISTLLPAIDRRGKTVIFTSYPNAGLTTANTTGPLGDDTSTGWDFVAQDTDGTWKSIYNLTCCSDPVGFITGSFKGVSEADDKQRLRRQLYYFIRFFNNSASSDASPVLQRLVESDDDFSVVVKASVAVDDPQTGALGNQTINVPVIAHLHLGADEGNIVEVGVRLGQISSGGTDYDANFQELPSASMTLRITTEDSNKSKDAAGNVVWTPKYFSVGFQQQAGPQGTAPTKLAYGSAQLANAISSNDPDTLIVSKPEWVLKTIDSKIINQTDLEDAATKLAPSYLKDSANVPKIIQCTGFFGEPGGSSGTSPLLNGSVAEVTWDQERVQTEFRLNTWFSPMSGLLNLKQHTSLAESLAVYPNQQATADARSAIGMSGSTAPVTMVGTRAPEPDTSSLFEVVCSCTNPGANGTAPAGLSATFNGFQYTITLGGETLATRQVPSWGPLVAGVVTPATHGAAKRSASGWQLCFAWEKVGGPVCSS